MNLLLILNKLKSKVINIAVRAGPIFESSKKMLSIGRQSSELKVENVFGQNWKRREMDSGVSVGCI